eukprot:scaffold216588_cov47-Prasinocladus_malaysianus.AAC.4
MVGWHNIFHHTIRLTHAILCYFLYSCTLPIRGLVSCSEMLGTENDALRLIPKEGWCYIKLQSVSVAISKGELQSAEQLMESVILIMY